MLSDAISEFLGLYLQSTSDYFVEVVGIKAFDNCDHNEVKLYLQQFNPHYKQLLKDLAYKIIEENGASVFVNIDQNIDDFLSQYVNNDVSFTSYLADFDFDYKKRLRDNLINPILDAKILNEIEFIAQDNLVTECINNTLATGIDGFDFKNCLNQFSSDYRNILKELALYIVNQISDDVDKYIEDFLEKDQISVSLRELTLKSALEYDVDAKSVSDDDSSIFYSATLDASIQDIVINSTTLEDTFLGLINDTDEVLIKDGDQIALDIKLSNALGHGVSNKVIYLYLRDSEGDYIWKDENGNAIKAALITDDKGVAHFLYDSLPTQADKQKDAEDLIDYLSRKCYLYHLCIEYPGLFNEYNSTQMECKIYIEY